MTNDSNERKIEWLRALKEQYEIEIQSNHITKLNAYKLEDDSKMDYCIGFGEALTKVVQDLEELLK